MTKPSLTRRQILRRAGAFGALAAAAPMLLRATPAGAALTPQDQEDVARVETYMNGITTMQARFQQVSQNGAIAFGTIYLRRPGRLRVEYDPPVPVLLVADGTLVSYYDSELDQLSQMPLRSSLAWFLLRDPISLGDGITVTDVRRAPGALRLSMHEADQPDAGSVTLVFQDHPLELRQWTTTDAQGTEVRVGLMNPSFGRPLANELFATPRTERLKGNNK